jgi:hypothetical protein
MLFMSTTSTKTKPKIMSDAALKTLETSEYRKRFLAPHKAGIQISLRLPRATLAKLSRLANANFQSKSQFITKLVTEIPDESA